jgi:hypothetical protein
LPGDEVRAEDDHAANLRESGSISGSLGFLSAEYDEFIGFQDDFTGQEVDVSGNDLSRAPDFNATISIVPTTFEGLGGT